VEPFESSVLNGFPGASHFIYGIGAGVIPPNVKPIYEGAIRIKSEEAVAMARRLALEEGLLAGVSGGANVLAALELAKRAENAGKLIVTSLADFGERYLSSVLYKDLREECEKVETTTVEEDRKLLSERLGLQL